MRQSDLSRFGIGTAKKQPEAPKQSVSPAKPKENNTIKPASGVETRSSG